MTCQHCGELIPEKRQRALIFHAELSRQEGDQREPAKLVIAPTCRDCAESNPAPLLRGEHYGYGPREDAPASDIAIFADHGYSYGRVNLAQQLRGHYRHA